MPGEVEPLTIERFREHLIHEVEHPLGNDSFMPAFAYGTLACIDDDERVRNTFQDVFEHRAGQEVEFTPQYAASLFQRLLQWCLIEDQNVIRPTYRRAYDDSFRSAAAWSWYISRRVFDNTEHDAGLNFIPGENLRTGLFWRDLVSNKSKRYISVPLLRHAMPEMFPEEPVFLDAGCSDNQGGKAAVLNGPWQDIEVISPDTPISIIEADVPADPRLTSAARLAIDKALPKVKIIGTDYWDKKLDPDIDRWRLVSSHYISEWTPRNIRNFRKRHNRVVDGVGFIQSDFSVPGTDLTENEVYRQLRNGTQRTDGVWVITTLYQLSQQKREAFIRNAGRHGRFVFVQDHLEIDESNPRNLKKIDEWNITPYPYLLSVLDSDNPERGFVPIMRYDGGRCRRLQPCDSEYGQKLTESLENLAA